MLIIKVKLMFRFLCFYLPCFFLLIACEQESFLAAVLEQSNFACESTQTIEETIIKEINILRSSSQQCGSDTQPAVRDVTWQTRLYRAANRHSQDMANFDYFSHIGSDSSSVGERTREAGYQWTHVGENIGAGYSGAKAALDAWLASEGHCKNLMSQEFTEIGVACAVRNEENSQYTIYWTMVLATPR